MLLVVYVIFVLNVTWRLITYERVVKIPKNFVRNSSLSSTLSIGIVKFIVLATLRSLRYLTFFFILVFYAVLI